ncbi:MAG: DNA polymerase III subunit delta [Bacteroides sp.]|nr:DNA polymerase III subunit delta [Bacteroides sp.]MCM1413483.1 DNA polymerase III subunit delta [Bacteroides sp.]MCM1471306.1 DNA polymerase III subunit delta [Bacteroides sp.]
MKFSDIPGHENAKTLMRRLVETDRIPHALLLEGPEGIGKLSLARAFAQYIHCENRTPDGEPCGHCQPCILHQSMNHIDCTYVYPVMKLDGMSSAPVSSDFRDQWLDYLDDRKYMDFQRWTSMFGKKSGQPVTYVTESSALIHQLAFTSHISRYKTVVWWLPEKMNIEAANKLLKLIEEPYDDTVFIMVSDSPRDILPTIYSRVQRISLKRLPDEIVENHLAKHHNLSKEDAKAMAHLANGNITRAEAEVSQSKESQEYFDLFVRLMRLAYQRNVQALREWSEELNALGRDRMVRFYDYSSRMVRENFMNNFPVPEITYLNSAESQFATRFSPFINEANVELLIDTFGKAATDISANANGKIVNLDVAIKIIMHLIKK